MSRTQFSSITLAFWYRFSDGRFSLIRPAHRTFWEILTLIQNLKLKNFILAGTAQVSHSSSNVLSSFLILQFIEAIDTDQEGLTAIVN